MEESTHAGLEPRSVTDAATDPLRQVTADHWEIRSSIEDINAASGELREKRVSRLCDVLILHTKMEEGALYPGLREQAPDLVAHLNEEHQEVDRLMASLFRRSYLSGDFEYILEKMLAAVGEHLQEEEERLFPLVRERVADDRELADKMRAARSRINLAGVRNELLRAYPEA